MSTRIFVSAAAGFAAIAAAAATAQAALPPDGTYDYSLRQGDSVIATSTVTVRRSGSVTSIRETQTVNQTAVGTVQLTADLTVIADSLTPLSFDGSTMSSGKTQEVKFAYSGGSGYFIQNGERLSVPVKMIFGTQAMIVQDQSLVLSFLTLPAVLQATKANSLTVAVPTASRIFAITVDPAPQNKPSGLPAADVAVAIASPIAYSVWFDPNTGVVDEIDVPSQSLVISLTKHP
ncbi:MAG TPA: hypothetical protein VKF82_09710 [Candidatus Eremiobacteraceae bacterium]|nr:hypothetical protein [Candidatus Eremiobacteraceae bacterium]